MLVSSHVEHYILGLHIRYVTPSSNAKSKPMQFKTAPSSSCPQGVSAWTVLVPSMKRVRRKMRFAWSGNSCRSLRLTTMNCRALEAQLDQPADVLRVRRVERGVDLVEYVHGRRLEPRSSAMISDQGDEAIWTFGQLPVYSR